MMLSVSDKQFILSVIICVVALIIGFVAVFLFCSWIEHDSARDIGNWVKQFNEASK